MKTMKPWLTYLLIFLLGIITAIVITVMSFSRMQYMVQRLEKHVGLRTCDGESFCNITTNQSQFIDLTEKDKNNWVQSRSAYIAMSMSLVSGIVGLLTIIPLGLISDMFGRKIALFIVFSGFAAEVIINALTVLFDWPLWVFILGTLPSSVFGNGVAGTLTQLYTCIADLTQYKGQQIALQMQSTHHRNSISGRRRQSILEIRKPESEATIEAAIASERLTMIAIFEAILNICVSTSLIVMGPIIQNYGFKISTYTTVILTVLGIALCGCIPNTRAFWCDDKTKLEKGKKCSKIVRNDEIVTEIKKPKSTCEKLKKVFVFVNKPVVFMCISLFLCSLVTMTDVPVLNLYFIGEPFLMSISMVGYAIGIRGIGMAVVSGLFVLFNMFYLQPKLASSKVPTVISTDHTSISISQDKQKHLKIKQARKMMLSILGVVLLVMTFSRFLYGIANLFNKPTCTIILIGGMVLNSFQFFGPLMRALLSTLVSAEAQGRLYALLGFFEAFGIFLGLTTLPAVYAATVSIYAGLVFQLSAIILLLAFIMTCVNCFILLVGKKYS